MHWMETKKFEKWFNALVLGGLSATLLLTSAIKLGDTPSGLPLALLLVSNLSDSDSSQTIQAARQKRKSPKPPVISGGTLK